jgi:beta-N-acetylhexosaminidase
VLPSQRAIGRVYDIDPEAGRKLAWACGWLLAAELRSAGIDMSFAPCIDLDYGVSEVIGDRAYHRDPEIVARLGVACMQGMRTAGMAATAKHFPGHGAVVADSHKALPIDRRPLAELTDDLLPYRRLIANGLSSVMIAHVLFPAVDEAPAGFSARWIQQELRAELGFTGAVFSDDLSMGGAAFAGNVPERARRAIDAHAEVVRKHGAGETELHAQFLLDPARRKTGRRCWPRSRNSRVRRIRSARCASSACMAGRRRHGQSCC